MNFSNLNDSTTETITLEPLGIMHDNKLNAQLTSFCHYASVLLSYENYSELLQQIHENQQVIRSSVFEILIVVIRKLYILHLIAESKFSKAFEEVILIKEYYEKAGINFSDYSNALFKILETPNFSRSALYQNLKKEVHDKVKHLILYEDYFIVDIDLIIHFEKASLSKEDDFEFSLETSPTESTIDCSYTSKRCTRKYIKASNLDNVRFSTIRKEIVNKKLAKLLIKAIRRASLDHKFEMGPSQYKIKGVIYKSCNNDYLSHLFSISDSKILYENKIVLHADSIEKSLIDKLKISNINDIKLLSWYIRNMHKIYSF